jgi:hypothetical protein
MNATLKSEYAKVQSAFYGIKGISKLSDFFDAFEKADKIAFDKAVSDSIKKE